MIKAAVTRADEVGTRNAASRRSHAGQSRTSAPVTGFPNGTGPMGDDPHHQQAPYPDLKFRNGFLMAAKRAFGGEGYSFVGGASTWAPLRSVSSVAASGVGVVESRATRSTTKLTATWNRGWTKTSSISSSSSGTATSSNNSSETL